MNTPGLAHYVVRPPGDAPPERAVVFCHGILGSGPNFRTFARRLVEASPRWAAVLVDLRHHGNSQGFAPPDTVAAAADDLIALEATLDWPVHAVVGHSFGGKVALAYVGKHLDAGNALDCAVVVDSAPGPRTSEIGQYQSLPVLKTLAALPPNFASRQAFVEYVQAHGHDAGIAQWLAMNVERDGDGFRFGLDLDAIRRLLDDYFAADLWSTIERVPNSTRFTMVLGGRSTMVPSHERERMFARAESDPDRVAVRVIADAGHWVHVDAPDALLEEVRRALDTQPDRRLG